MPQYRAKGTKLAAQRKSHSATQPSKPASGSVRSTVHAIVQRDGSFYVVECLELPVVTQGRTLDEAVSNIQEALSLHLEGEDPAALGLVAEPRIEIIYDMALACPA
jgi:predicted RNase H-like HicB family nuclease